MLVLDDDEVEELDDGAEEGVDEDDDELLSELLLELLLDSFGALRLSVR